MALKDVIGKVIGGVSKFIPIPGAAAIGDIAQKGLSMIGGKTPAMASTGKGTVVSDTKNAIKREKVLDDKIKKIEKQIADSKKVRMSLFGENVNLSAAAVVDKVAKKSWLQTAMELGKKKTIAAGKSSPVKLKTSDVGKVYEFEKQRSLLKNNLSKVRKNISVLWSRAKKIGYASVKSVIKNKIRDAEAKLNKLEREIKGLSATNFADSPFIELSPVQGQTVLKGYNEKVTAINTSLKSVESAIDQTPKTTAAAPFRAAMTGGTTVRTTAGTVTAGRVSPLPAFVIPAAIAGGVLLLLTARKK